MSFLLLTGRPQRLQRMGLADELADHPAGAAVEVRGSAEVRAADKIIVALPNDDRQHDAQRVAGTYRRSSDPSSDMTTYFTCAGQSDIRWYISVMHTSKAEVPMPAGINRCLD